MQEDKPMASIYTPLRREITVALGEAQTENPWIEAQIALQLVRARLEQAMAGSVIEGEDGAVMEGSAFVRQLFTAAPV